jgi:L-iditol 2-dehydrogenase
MAPPAMIDTTTEVSIDSVPIPSTKLRPPIVLKTSLPNPSIQVTADHKLKQVEAPVHSPRPGEVLLHVKATGVCGYGVHLNQTFE